MSITNYHSYAGGQHRYGDYQQQRREEYRPAEQLYIGEQVEQREGRHRQYGRYKVNASEQRGQAGHVQREEQQVNAAIVHLGQRHIKRPARIHSAINQQTQHNQYQGEETQP